MDVKDILGVSRTPGEPPERQEKPKEKKLVKPKGMSREAFALLSASHPLAPSQLVGDLRKASGLEATKARVKRSARGAVTFRWMPFTNEARTDKLQLSHWTKCYKDATGRVAPADQGPYSFAKYNKQPLVYRYNDEEWDHLVAPQSDGSWSRQETDYLLNLVELCDMRWPVVVDRYSWAAGEQGGEGSEGSNEGKEDKEATGARSLEEIKARYFEVARHLLVGRAGGSEPVANNVIVSHPYSAAQERERRAGVELLLGRTREEDAAEDEVLSRAAAIQARRKAEQAGRKAQEASAGELEREDTAAQVPEEGGETRGAAVEPVTTYGDADEVGVPPLFDGEGQPAAPPAGTYVMARGAFCRELAEAAMQKLQPTKVQKAVESSMAELKMEAFPRCASRASCGAYLALFSEVTQLMKLKRQLATKQAMLVGAKRQIGRDSDLGDLLRPDKRQRAAKKMDE